MSKVAAFAEEERLDCASRGGSFATTNVKTERYLSDLQPPTDFIRDRCRDYGTTSTGTPCQTRSN